jgi:hypothetical protein
LPLSEEHRRERLLNKIKRELHTAAVLMSGHPRVVGWLTPADAQWRSTSTRTQFATIKVLLGGLAEWLGLHTLQRDIKSQRGHI